MKLYLSSTSPLCSVYTHESGQVLYRVETPLGIGSQTSRIKKVVPSPRDPMYFEESGDFQGWNSPYIDDDDLRDQYINLASIEYKLVRPSVMRFAGGVVGVRQFFRKEGRGPIGRHLTFIGPDGKRYLWYMTWGAIRLYLNDGSRTLVASSRMSPSDPSSDNDGRPAYLEVFPPGLKMLDTVVTTFVVAEQRRIAKEQAARHQGAVAW